ncbi:MAG TPA: hypothetical protein VGT40_24735 [Methylomirabilota bacterium]|jgi:hypothetical protein|nr:hypothetical protein [Methylomirabilota bacterium]
MLNQLAFANSLALLTGGAFRLFFNAQFMGADVASLVWVQIPAGTFILSLLLAVLTAWVFGYAWAWLYNMLAR